LPLAEGRRTGAGALVARLTRRLRRVLWEKHRHIVRLLDTSEAAGGAARRMSVLPIAAVAAGGKLGAGGGRRRT
jgi:hypothetical protein